MKTQDTYPDRLEVPVNPKVKVVFAKNTDAFHGYDCWLEGRSGKPVSGRAVTMQEMALLEYIFKLSAGR